MQTQRRAAERNLRLNYEERENYHFKRLKITQKLRPYPYSKVENPYARPKIHPINALV
jgi:hypothetical protein